MRTINVSISEVEYDKFGIKSDQLSFTDLINIVSRQLSIQTLHNSIELADRFGLSSLTMDEITEEVKAVRKNAKDNH